jgi:putative methyltransferase (TIGR04325 family)
MINLSFLKRHKQDKPQFGVFGDYPSWEAALADSAPYKTDLKIYHNICDRIRAGKAASGRNPMPLLAGLALLQGPAHVLDFGGNLGMMYFEIDRLAPGKIASWHIADLPEVASYGNANLAGDKLRFITDWASERPNLVLSSHALQCIERPYKTLSSLLETGPDVLILHELPVAPNRRFAVQHLLPELGGVRPIQILEEAALTEATQGYDLLSEVTLPTWASFPNTRQVARIYKRRLVQNEPTKDYI